MLSNKMKEMETEFDLNDHIVIDLGNAYTKIGFSGEDQPTITIPSIYARSKIYDSDKKNELSSYDQKMDVFGYEATEPQYQTDYIITSGDIIVVDGIIIRTSALSIETKNGRFKKFKLY